MDKDFFSYFEAKLYDFVGPELLFRQPSRGSQKSVYRRCCIHVSLPDGRQNELLLHFPHEDV